MEIKTLESISRDRLADAFEEAFADYATRFSRNQIMAILQRRGYRGEYSFGVFDGQRIVSFVFNGVRMLNGVLTAYDSGTGTVKEFRGRGLTSRLLDETQRRLSAKGVGRYVLEVLCDNDAAIALYRKSGFEVTRKFSCHARPINDLTFTECKPDGVEIRVVTPAEIQNVYAGFCDAAPSWQNDIQSMLADPTALIGFGAFDTENNMVGCIMGDHLQGDVMALGVRPDMRGHGIGSTLLHTFTALNEADIIKMLNVDERCASMLSFLKRHDIPVTVYQFEMQKSLAK